jgi:hypothetical protein
VPSTIYRLGDRLQSWRAHQQRDHQQWASQLYSGGFNLAPGMQQLIHDLQLMEAYDLWPYHGPLASAVHFAIICKQVLAHDVWEHEAADDLIYLTACHACAPLGVRVLRPPYHLGQHP